MNMFELMFQLANRVGLLIMIAFIFSRTKMFGRIITKRNIRIKDKILMAIFFGAIGMLGSYTGIPFRGALVNTRVVGVVIAGLMGGPVVGIVAGVIAGVHRFVIDPGGVTAFACMISTIAEGVFSGFLSKKFHASKDPVVFSFFTAFAAECIQMSIIILLVSPFKFAAELVMALIVPMTVMNSIGVGVFMSFVQNVKILQETEAAFTAQQTLKIAKKTLKYFKNGLEEVSGKEVVTIIHEMTNFCAVALIDKEKLIAHAGTGSENHVVGNKIATSITRKAMNTGKYCIAQNSDEITHGDKCKLKSAIIVPLMINEKSVGALKLYKDKENAISRVDEELAIGLANLFSSQIGLSRLEYEKDLRSKAELKALQAQINPHFLFNAINTIVSLIRTSPNEARELLIYLGEYFRNNMQIDKPFINIDDELSNVDTYLKIEKARFGEKLNYEIQIPEDLNIQIPPLIIQPLVENAVKHGIFAKEGEGTVKVELRETKDSLYISVEDDGVGFISGKNEDSIGLKNIERRLKVIYGSTYTFSIWSSINKGTIVTIVIPKEGGEVYDKVHCC